MIRPSITFAMLCLALAPAPALAGAWTQEEGRGQVLLTGIYSHSGKGFDASGKRVDIADYTKTEAYALVEYGLTDGLTLMLDPSLRHVQVEDGDDTSGLGYTDVGARWRLAKGQDWVFSVQGLARIPGARRRDNLAQVGSVNSEFDLRALAGKSFKAGGMDGFVDVQGSYRFRTGSPPDEFHADVTVGIRPAPRLLLMAQSFNTFSNGSGQGIFTKYRYHNIYLSGLYDITPNIAFQIGGIATLDGENALRERGLLTGLWFKF